jgi:hypothetical protein
VKFYEELVDKFGSETEDSVYRYYNRPLTVPGRLQFFGLLHTGTRAGTAGMIALIPEDLQPQMCEIDI